MISAAELALAFNQQNTRKTWTARPSNTLVHFNPGTGLIALIYDTVDGTWQVRFNKYTAAWGDYVKAIARTFYVVLSTLKSAGLPFEAPDQPEGIDIVTTVGAEGSIYVRYDPPAIATTVAQATMPELRTVAANPALAMPYTGDGQVTGDLYGSFVAAMANPDAEPYSDVVGP